MVKTYGKSLSHKQLCQLSLRAVVCRLNGAALHCHLELWSIVTISLHGAMGHCDLCLVHYFLIYDILIPPPRWHSPVIPPNHTPTKGRCRHSPPVGQFTEVQCSAMQCNAVQCSAVQCSVVQCSVVHSSLVQCSEVHCSAVQLSIVQ